MDAYQFLQTFGKSELDRVADAAGYGRTGLYHIALGHRNARLEAAEKIAAASGGRMDVWSLMRSTTIRVERERIAS